MASHTRRTALLLLTVSSLSLSAAAAEAQNATALDQISVTATKTEEKAIDSLASVSTVGGEQIQQLQPTRLSDILFGQPSVWFQQRGDRPESAINIRGLQDFGRVAVIIDGARQNFQVSGHNANGTFFLDPELLASLDITRGPVANVYGSGAIGGVASFRTKDVDDILKPGERWGVQGHVMGGTNGPQGLGSVFAAGRINENVEVMAGGSYRSQNDYRDGHGNRVPNSGYDVGAGIAKFTLRPADGHELKFGAINQNYFFSTGQLVPNQESVYSTHVRNTQVNGRWKYQRPDDRLFDFEISTYWTGTQQKQVKTANGTPGSNGNPITGFVGDPRSFGVDTTGIDAHNTSRLDTGPVRHSFTYGADFFRDIVHNIDNTGNGAITTPNGTRTVSGGFFQWKAEYSSWLQLINAVRYDDYQLETPGISTGGNHLSPKTTLGITPIRGLTVYGTFAEGYRAPSVTETLVAGAHPPFAVGLPNLFTFLPNPNLTPETGQTKEVGLNLNYDDIFRTGDKFRAKLNFFRNDLSNYIDLVNFGPPVTFCFGPPASCLPPGAPSVINPTSLAQYQNTGDAHISGVELNADYDAGSWFAAIAGQVMRGRDQAGLPLATVQPDQVATTLGIRSDDRKLTLAVRWAAIAAKSASEVPDRNGDGVPDFLPTGAYNLVNLYLGYSPVPDVTTSFSIDNLLNQYYVPYLAGAASAAGQTPGVVFPGAGITFKAGLQIRFAAK